MLFIMSSIDAFRKHSQVKLNNVNVKRLVALLEFFSFLLYYCYPLSFLLSTHLPLHLSISPSPSLPHSFPPSPALPSPPFLPSLSLPFSLPPFRSLTCSYVVYGQFNVESGPHSLPLGI